MSTAQLLFPWKSLSDTLTLQVSAKVLGRREAQANEPPRPVSVKFIDPGRLRINVVGAEPDWRAVALDVKIAASAGDGGLDLGRCRGHLVLAASQSATRISERLRPTSDGLWHGTLLIHRDEVFGVATLRAMIAEPQPGAAPRIVGSSEDWVVVFDEVPGPHGSHGVSPIPMHWASFSKPDVEKGHPRELAGFPDAVAYCAAGGAEPVLYLNDDIDGLQQLLDGTHLTGLQARAQDLIGAHIALETLTALVDAAVTRIGQYAVGQDGDGEEFDPTEALQDYPALQSALDEVAKVAQFVTGYDDAVAQIATAAQEDDAAGETLTLRGKFTAAAQSVVGAPKATADLLKEVLDA